MNERLHYLLTEGNSEAVALAESELQAMSLQEVLAFLAFVRNKRVKKFRKACIGVVCVFTVLIIMGACIDEPFYARIPGAVWLSMFFTYSWSRKSYIAGSKALSRFEDPASVSELISALEVKDWEVNEVVRPALVRILVRLRASDSRFVSTANRRTLRNYLAESPADRFNDLTIAILSALKQVGDGSFVEVVSRLANSEVHHVGVGVREAANECLPYLQQLAFQQSIGNELLRGSQSSTTDTDMLVTPAAYNPEDHEDELLRPLLDGQD